MKHHVGKLLLTGLFACLLTACAAKAPQQREERCCPCKSARQLSERLMASLASARAYHHQADIHLRQKEVDKAMAA